MSLRPGEVFAGYTVERELGSGGMGSVFLVRHPRLPRYDALKLLRAELCDDPAFVGRFEREADTVAQLDHPNIVAVHDRGSQDGQLWISMRFIDGTNAEKALADYHSGMPPERAVRIVSRVASALDYAHRHDLLHRDVKPANILLASGADDDETERVFLSDFGVAKAIGVAAEREASLTSTGSVVATLDYASPEQIKGQPLDHRSDIYALGCVLYKLLTGSVPYPGESVAARVYGHLNNPPPAPSARVPSVPRGFDEVVATAMAKEPADRYPTCRALAAAAREALTTAPDSAVRPADRDDGLPTTLTAAAGAVAGVAAVGPAGPDTGEQAAAGQGPPSQPRTFPGTRPEETAGPMPPPPGGRHSVLPDAPVPDYPLAGYPDPDRAGPDGAGPAAPATGPHADPAAAAAAAAARPQQIPVTSTPPPAEQAAGRSADRPPTRRRTVAILSVVGAVLAAGAVTAFVLRGGGTAGIATIVTSSQTQETPPTTDSTTTPNPSPSSSLSSSPAPTTAATAVPGLPHSTPIGDQLLLASRVANGAEGLFQVDTASGQVGQQVLTDTSGPQFSVISQDRGSLIYVQAGANTLRTTAVDGTGDRLLFDTPPADCQNYFRPAWNPVDQTEIALVCTTSAGAVALNLVGIDGKVRSPVITGLATVDDVAYSPDGKSLTYWGSDSQGAGGGRIYVQPVAGGAATPITDPGAGNDADPVFSPDGSQIAFRRIDTDAGGGTIAAIYVVNVDGSGEPTPLTDGTSVDQDPIYSPDGTQVAFKSNRLNAAGTNDNQIWVVPVDGSAPPRELGVGAPGVADGAPAWGHR
ncbi:MAG TPA: protein kinase [Nakamurella sp.]|nr:protein kinase [Nakamurella sp.]